MSVIFRRGVGFGGERPGTCWSSFRHRWNMDLHVVLTHWSREIGWPFSSRLSQMHFIEWKYIWISIEISLTFVRKSPNNNSPTLVQIMAWCRPGAKPLPEPMMVRLPTHICITRPQWDNKSRPTRVFLNNQLTISQHFPHNGLEPNRSHRKQLWPSLLTSLSFYMSIRVNVGSYRAIIPKNGLTESSG